MRRNIWVVCLSILIFVGFFPVKAENTGDWRIWINIPEHRLYLLYNEQIYQSFNIAVGKPSTPSPVGDFWVVNKVINPTWFPPDKREPVPPGPKNPLGKYWLGLNKKGYGIHGNNAPASIGNAVSHGCFRMNNQDIEWLFRTIPVKTPVSVTYFTVFAEVDESEQAWLNVYPDIYHRMNQVDEITYSVYSMSWSYIPHLKALSYVVKDKYSLHLEIPRVVEVSGFSKNLDAFFWNGSVYVDKAAFELVEPVFLTPQTFPGYIDIQTLGELTNGKFQFEWSEKLNILNCMEIRKIL